MVEPTSERHEVEATEVHNAAVGPIIPLVDEVVGEGERPSLHVRLFGSHAFFRLWLSQAISSLGDWLGFLAITILAARIGGESSGAAVGIVMAARIIPGFFLSPVAGVLVDRIDRRKVMIVCDLGRAIVVVFLPFVDNVLELVFISLLLEIGTLFFGPAKEASVPNLVPPERLASANSLSLAAAYGTFPLAAIMFALLAKVSEALGNIDVLDFLKTDQETLAFVVRIATFLLSAAVIWSLHLPSPERKTNGGSSRRIDWAQTWHELREGWQFIFLTPVVRAVNLGLATGLIGGGMVVPLGSIFSEHVLHAGPAGFGIFVTALGVGVAVGVVLISVVQKRLPKSQMFTMAMFGAGGSLFAAASMSSLTTAFIFVFVLGMCAGAIYVLGFTLLHENVADELRGRIFSALYTIVRLCLLIAFALGPLLSDVLDKLSKSLFTDPERTVNLPAGRHLFVPGERLTLWFAALIILFAATIVAWSLRASRSKETV